MCVVSEKKKWIYVDNIKVLARLYDIKKYRGEDYYDRYSRWCNC